MKKFALQCLRQFWVAFAVLMCLSVSLIVAQEGKESASPKETESLPCICPKCKNTDGEWYISYFSYPMWSQYFSAVTKNERDLVLDSIGKVKRNPPADDAEPVNRTASFTITISYTSSRSGSSTVEIQSELGIPNKASIGGGFSNTSEWTMAESGSSEYTVSTERICNVGSAIWERAYHYDRKIVGTRYRYNDNLEVNYWCPQCKNYTCEKSFTDFYDHVQATFIFPDKEVGVVDVTGSYDADVWDSSFYEWLKPHYDDDSEELLDYQPDKGSKTIYKRSW